MIDITLVCLQIELTFICLEDLCVEPLRSSAERLADFAV